ncbi:MAG: hypothetical protein FJ290_19440 [Planctomycetes bacterium]|nr:hypothetical protein [Planctomycetota bacterium]
MNGLPEDLGAGPLDDIARLLDQLEAAQEAHVELGTVPLMELGFADAGVGRVAPWTAPPPISDDYLDPLARELGALEDSQETLSPLPPPEIEDPVPYKPEVQRYGSFGTQPPPLSEPGIHVVGKPRADGWHCPHRVGGYTGAARRHISGVWCPHKEGSVSEPHDGCKACEEECPFAAIREDEDDGEE